MISLVRWAVPHRVIEIQYAGVFALDDLKATQPILTRIVTEQGQGPLVHVMLHSLPGAVYDKSLFSLAALNNNLTRDDGLPVPYGYFLAVTAAVNRALWFTSSVTAQLLGLRFRVVEGSTADGLALLYTLDETLDRAAQPLPPIDLAAYSQADP
ncbi:MAG: hypothetical protein SF162_17195 [bacterium]|nr:hypothetical protein [bacterium]